MIWCSLLDFISIYFDMLLYTSAVWALEKFVFPLPSHLMSRLALWENHCQSVDPFADLLGTIMSWLQQAGAEFECGKTQAQRRDVRIDLHSES